MLIGIVPPLPLASKPGGRVLGVNFDQQQSRGKVTKAAKALSNLISQSIKIDPLNGVDRLYQVHLLKTVKAREADGFSLFEV
jgi:hypothetical protein